jgi:hypothetical protein
MLFPVLVFGVLVFGALGESYKPLSAKPKKKCFFVDFLDAGERAPLVKGA